MTGAWIGRILGVSLGMTIALEFLFAVAVGVRNRKDLLLLVLVNVMTNPPVVLTYYLLALYTPLSGWPVQIPLEILAVLAEAYCYRSYGRETRRPFRFSLFANAFSFGVGALLNAVVSYVS